MIDPLKSLPGYLLRRVSNSLRDELSKQLSELGLRPSEASILLLIQANAEITPSALGQMLGIKRANMVPIIARLERKDLVLRTALDGRSYGMSLTPLGKKTHAKVNDVIKSHEDDIIARIPKEDQEHFVSALKSLWLS